jgi:hypothetical protein
MNSADDLTHLGISGSSDGACVEHRNLTLLSARALLKAGLKKLVLESRAISLASSAAEIEKEK